jgi:cysteinyl-tRNA synthetase
MLLKAAKTWGYQLQNIKPKKIAASPYDLVVIDYASDDGPFTSAQVEQMKRKPDGSRRLVIAYMSIGEAETYRPYWNKAWRKEPPPWLGKENRQWRGNFGVKFWEPGWQAIVFDYADRIVEAGFDGIYLDKVDEFEDLGHPDEMVEFVVRIAARVKAKNPAFLVISQNGDGLLSNKRFRDAIDAFAREDLFFGEDDDGKPNQPDSIEESIARLRTFAGENKPVFVVEYPRGKKQRERARSDIAALGFIGHTAGRDLEKL